MIGVKSSNMGRNMGNKSYQALKSMGVKSSGQISRASGHLSPANSIPIYNHETNGTHAINTPFGLVKKNHITKRNNTIEKR